MLALFRCRATVPLSDAFYESVQLSCLLSLCISHLCSAPAKPLQALCNFSQAPAVSWAGSGHIYWHIHTHKCTHAHTHSSALEQILTDFKSQKQSVPAPDISLPRVSISEKERNSRISLLTKQGSLSTYGTLPYKVPPAHREQIHISGQSDTQPRSRPVQGLERPSSLLSHRRPNVPQGMMGHKLMPSRQWAGVTWEEVNLWGASHSRSRMFLQA